MKNQPQTNHFNIFDISRYIYYNMPVRYATGVTQLQKLLYYAQGEYLKRYQKPLFNEEIEAWDYGPVIPTVYFEFANYLSQNKDVFHYKCTPDAKLPKSVIEVLDTIIRTHGLKSAVILSEETYNEEPWKCTFDPKKPYARKVITHKTMYNFFKNK